MGVSKKKCLAEENSKGNKFAVECDWTGKISQNSKKNWAVFQKTDWFFLKNLEFFKNRESSKFAVKCDWKSKTSQNVQKMASAGKN